MTAQFLFRNTLCHDVIMMHYVITDHLGTRLASQHVQCYSPLLHPMCTGHETTDQLTN
jgi:hypothetical protein